MENNEEAERRARRFHEVYESVAPQFGVAAPVASCEWDDLAIDERRALIATAAVLIREEKTVSDSAQQLEFDRNHWQRKVGVLLALIDRYAPGSPLQEAARNAVNTNWYTKSMGDPVADIAQLTTEKTIETAIAAGLVTKPNGAG
jgi:hypothetical protein